MPKLPPRPCSTPRCRNMATKKGKCDEHQPKARWNENGRRYKREMSGWEWDRVRERILKRDGYLCLEHKKRGVYVPGNEVDHIIPKEHGGTDDDSNLQTLCKECHKEKTIRERCNGKLSDR